MLAGGATVPRGLPVPGADLDGVHQAMEYLPLANRAVAEPAGAGAADEPADLGAARRGTWSSSAAATPAPTAWAPRYGRAPRR